MQETILKITFRVNTHLAYVTVAETAAVYPDKLLLGIEEIEVEVLEIDIVDIGVLEEHAFIFRFLGRTVEHPVDLLVIHGRERLFRDMERNPETGVVALVLRSSDKADRPGIAVVESEILLQFS